MVDTRTDLSKWGSVLLLLASLVAYGLCYAWGQILALHLAGLCVWGSSLLIVWLTRHQYTAPTQILVVMVGAATIWSAVLVLLDLAKLLRQS